MTYSYRLCVTNMPFPVSAPLGPTFRELSSDESSDDPPGHDLVRRTSISGSLPGNSNSELLLPLNLGLDSSLGNSDEERDEHEHGDEDVEEYVEEVDYDLDAEHEHGDEGVEEYEEEVGYDYDTEDDYGNGEGEEYVEEDDYFD